MDINYEIKDNKPEIWMWGIDGKGKRILVIDRNFTPYFYLVLNSQENPNSVLERVREKQAEIPHIADLELTVRRLFGQPVYAIKVLCQNPESISEVVKPLSKVNGVEKCLEHDIRYSMRYIIDNNVSPCGWYEIEVNEVKNDSKIQVDKVLTAQSSPIRIDKEGLPQLKILSFYPIFYASKGSPKPNRDPVLIIATVFNTGEKKIFVAKNHDDSSVIKDFIECVKKFDPDIIAGFETNRLQWQYLIERANKHNFNLIVDRANGVPHISVYGHMSITGRINLDILDFAEELPEVKVKTLENLADYLKIDRGKQQIFIDETEYAPYWENETKRVELIKFAMERAECISQILGMMLNYTVELSKLVGLPLDHVIKAAVGFRTEWYMIREAYKVGELIPERIDRPYIPYVGGIVLSPKPGIHENITVLDFKSMYPNIMIEKNISPDTYIPPLEPDPPSGVNIAPEVGHKFRKEPPGFYKKILSNLLTAREEIRKKMSQMDSKSDEYGLLDARQRVVKVITNAVYGYTGWLGARWFQKPVAEAVAAWGRDMILSSIKMAREFGLEIIYGDTDSIFIEHQPQKIEMLCKTIKENLGLELKPDKFYQRVLFTEAKKRYCGLLSDGTLDTVGLEVVRGDWAKIAKDVQEKVLEMVLRERSVEGAVRFVKERIKKIREQKVPFTDLIIWKTLTKSAEQYEVNAPHVQAAKILTNSGWDLTVGDKIGYVITRGTGKLYERAKPYIFASYDEVDKEYYISKQVIPSALRILSLFGLDEQKLLEDEILIKPKKLTDFIG
ncbi:MAG: DNA polymerase domain-containing protein [Candidatus Bathyarchaeia archaeon]